MASFGDLIGASPEQLVNLFVRVKAADSNDFLVKINHTAKQLGLNHAQLVCSLGFNKHMRDLTDVLTKIGFSNFKLMSYRRNELFQTDPYDQLKIDNILDIYTARIEDAEVLNEIQDMLITRFENIETALADAEDTTALLSYKMELHAIYTSGAATEAFAQHRAERPIGQLRQAVNEIQMILDAQLIAAGNLFFMNTLLA